MPRLTTKKHDISQNNTGGDNNLEKEFKLWLPNNGVKRLGNTYTNNLNAIGGTGSNKNRLYNLVQKMTGKSPVPVFSIYDPVLLREQYNIVFLIKEWNGRSKEKLREIKDECQQEISEKDILEIRSLIKQLDNPKTGKKTSDGTLSSALGKYEAFLKWRKSQIQGNPPHTTASPNPYAELMDKDGNPIPRNLIYFGAPGTGKSHQLKVAVEGETGKAGNIVKDNGKGIFIEAKGKEILERRYERVTFYPTYSYAQFVGCYKPVMNGPDIAYEFVPGPFLRVLVNALNEKPGEDGKKKNWCLVIEEINRANAAAVFGDVFQLLDRATKDSADGLVREGESEYDIAASEDIRRYLTEENGDDSETEAARKFLKVEKDGDGKTCLDKNGIWKSCRLRIPSNMYIWATMNSADQGVFPLDTAFKRRWEFEYVGIDDGVIDNGVTNECGKWTIAAADGPNWNALRMVVNGLLSSAGVNEDKLMGPWFVKPENGSVVSEKQFKSKVLMYLWEDAARMCRKKIFEDAETFSGLVNKWSTNKLKIFNKGSVKNLKFEFDKGFEEAVQKIKDDIMVTPEESSI